jgi:CDP-2,3-bis-(O-geranylgeranyl)-sn-glycerol synthase
MNELAYFTYWFLKYYLPPMIANASPVLIRGSHRIDFSHKFIDDKPLFGRNKTWEGFFIGVYLGFLTSISLAYLFCNQAYVLIGLGASVSALIGDLIGSFIKRRLNIASGEPLPLIDQLDFALLATLYYYILYIPEYVSRPDYVLYSLLLILGLHILTNNIAYYMGVKDKRW